MEWGKKHIFSFSATESTILEVRESSLPQDLPTKLNLKKGSERDDVMKTARIQNHYFGKKC